MTLRLRGEFDVSAEWVNSPDLTPLVDGFNVPIGFAKLQHNQSWSAEILISPKFEAAVRSCLEHLTLGLRPLGNQLNGIFYLHALALDSSQTSLEIIEDLDLDSIRLGLDE